ncbi:MAG: DNA-3-methyladenine glycosylase 2 family protein [Eubacteriales bacterium]|nr:DNA-3-methyladenine glycosylase 2 family protein [Eubacteriales bacterium]
MKGEIFPFGDREISWLSSRDPELGSFISRMKKPERKLFPDIFSGLVFHIISQQISVKAAETEWKRFQELFSPVTPENVRCYSPEEIQKAGTALRRAGYIRRIAEQLSDGTINWEALPEAGDNEFDDAAFVKEITKLPGVGEWTAEMILIHVLKRPDVINFKDLAVRRGMRMVYHVPAISREFREFQEPRPGFHTFDRPFKADGQAGAGITEDLPCENEVSGK